MMASGASRNGSEDRIDPSAARAIASDPPRTLQEALRLVSRELTDAGTEDAQREARALVALATGLSALDILTEPDTPLEKAAQTNLVSILMRRLAHEPLSRIAGEREFYGRSFQVSPATLDPRADSETLIDTALKLLDRTGLTNEPLRILDIGTGTGCLIITLLAELPNARGTACDISSEALEIARANADRLAVTDRLEFIQSDLLENIDGRYNLIVSNPPYIPSAEIAELDREVRDYDPALALDGGADGLDFYRRIAQRLKSLLPQAGVPGFALFEIGAGQARDVEAIMLDAGLGLLGRWEDLGGHTRCVAIQAHG